MQVESRYYPIDYLVAEWDGWKEERPIELPDFRKPFNSGTCCASLSVSRIVFCCMAAVIATDTALVSMY